MTDNRLEAFSGMGCNSVGVINDSLVPYSAASTRLAFLAGGDQGLAGFSYQRN